jgi:hypothetical protein
MIIKQCTKFQVSKISHVGGGVSTRFCDRQQRKIIVSISHRSRRRTKTDGNMSPKRLRWLKKSVKTMLAYVIIVGHQHVTHIYSLYHVNGTKCMFQPWFTTVIHHWLDISMWKISWFILVLEVFFTYIETSPLLVKGCKFQVYGQRIWPLSREESLLCHVFRDTGLRVFFASLEGPPRLIASYD